MPIASLSHGILRSTSACYFLCLSLSLLCEDSESFFIVASKQQSNAFARTCKEQGNCCDMSFSPIAVLIHGFNSLVPEFCFPLIFEI